MIIKEGNELYEIWRDVPIPIHMQFYMFDLVNPQEVLDGGKPCVAQRGPYTYRYAVIKDRHVLVLQLGGPVSL